MPSAGLATEVTSLSPSVEQLTTQQPSVNLNQASAVDIARAFKGIGQRRAQAIVDYRDMHGPFTHIHQLANVKGISQQFVTQHRQALTTTFVLK
ncbi:MAG: helix-hairpin-helix domain-containing protein [Legionellales bacterium]|nr:helix-hairpin-helix domain-containing protein [Legionellales bacterium]